MSTSPEPTPDNDSARSTAKSADGPKLLFAGVYPLVAGTALWGLGFFALMGLLHFEAGYAVLFVLAAIAVIGGGHVWFRKIPEDRSEPRPWRLPTVLSTARALGICVAVLPIFLNVDLAEQVRPAEPGEAGEVVSVVMDRNGLNPTAHPVQNWSGPSHGRRTTGRANPCSAICPRIPWSSEQSAQWRARLPDRTTPTLRTPCTRTHRRRAVRR